MDQRVACLWSEPGELLGEAESEYELAGSIAACPLARGLEAARNEVVAVVAKHLDAVDGERQGTDVAVRQSSIALLCFELFDDLSGKPSKSEAATPPALGLILAMPLWILQFRRMWRALVLIRALWSHVGLVLQAV